jgi:hypothetical protein
MFGAAGTDYKQRAAAEYQNILLGGNPKRKALPQELFTKGQNQRTIFGLLQDKESADKLEAAQTKDADRKQALKDYETKLGIKSELENTGGKKSIELADSLRKELGGKKSLNDFAEVKNRVEVLKKAKNDPTAISDLDYVYGAAKVLDPASVVRESEAGMVIQSSSIPSALLGYFNKLTTGGQALSPEVRDSLFKLVKRHYDSRATEIGKELDRYESLANKRGVAPEDVLPFTRNDLLMADDSAPETEKGGMGGDMLSFLTEAKKSGMSREQARAAWEAQGGR